MIIFSQLNLTFLFLRLSYTYLNWWYVFWNCRYSILLPSGVLLKKEIWEVWQTSLFFLFLIIYFFFFIEFSWIIKRIKWSPWYTIKTSRMLSCCNLTLVSIYITFSSNMGGCSIFNWSKIFFFIIIIDYY